MKKIWMGIIIVCIIVVLFIAGQTYSYYVDEYNKGVNYKIARWIVLVNEKDITLERDKEFTINNYIYTHIDDTDTSSANNKFAPGMEASFTIEIDSKKVDVAFDYYLDIDMSEITNPNIRIKSVDNTLSNVEYVDDVYHGYFDKDNVINNNKDIITVVIEWVNDQDEYDYEFIKEFDGSLSIPISIKLKQRME